MGDFFAATNSAGYVGKAMIGVSEQMAGYPKGVSITSPFPTQALTRLYTIIASTGDDSEALVEVYDASGYFFGEPLAAGSSGPGQFTFSEASIP